MISSLADMVSIGPMGLYCQAILIKLREFSQKTALLPILLVPELVLFIIKILENLENQYNL